MPSNWAYIFLELAIVTYAVGFGWEHWNIRKMFTSRLLCAMLLLAVVWFALDEIAVSMGFWDFPEGGTLPIRILRLPLEEYIIFFLHSVVCFILIGRYGNRAS